MATYTRFSQDDIVITTERVFTNTFSANALTSYNRDAPDRDTPSSSGAFFEQAQDGSSNNMYTVAYGHYAGSGSQPFTVDDVGYSAPRSIYSQYRSLVYGDETRNFTFNGYEPQDIFVINIDRARYKQSLRLGSLNLTLKDSSNIGVMTDDSVTRSGSAVLTNIGRQYNVVSGSNGIMSGSGLSQTDSGSFGLFYPDAGIIILNPDALYDAGLTDALPTRDQSLSSVSTNVGNLTDSIGAGASFILDSEEKISSQFYFVRAKNKEFNYTTNPSFIDDKGNLNLTSMVDNPTTYITTVGLYNDANELLAVAKLSQPLTKDFTKEALIKVKLDY